MISLPAHNVLSALRKSVMLRTSQHRIFEVRTKIELNSFIVDLYSWRTYTFRMLTYNGCCFKRLNLTQFSFLFCYILNSINCVHQEVILFYLCRTRWMGTVLARHLSPPSLSLWLTDYIYHKITLFYLCRMYWTSYLWHSQILQEVIYLCFNW